MTTNDAKRSKHFFPELFLLHHSSFRMSSFVRTHFASVIIKCYPLELIAFCTWAGTRSFGTNTRRRFLTRFYHTFTEDELYDKRPFFYLDREAKFEAVGAHQGPISLHSCELLAALDECIL